jgi:hypothetical protein
MIDINTGMPLDTNIYNEPPNKGYFLIINSLIIYLNKFR